MCNMCIKTQFTVYRPSCGTTGEDENRGYDDRNLTKFYTKVLTDANQFGLLHNFESPSIPGPFSDAAHTMDRMMKPSQQTTK